MVRRARRYERGFPARVRRDTIRRQWGELFGCLPFLAIFTGMAVAGVIGTWSLLRDESSVLLVLEMVFLVPICLLFLFMSAFWLWALGHAIARPRGPKELFGRIIPYFEKRVGVPWRGAPAKGHALARHAERLDSVALDRGVTPFSDLGLDDDLAWKPDRWRDPEVGLTTLASLREAIQTHRDDWEEADLLLEEIDALVEALEMARNRGVRFCLLISLSNDDRVYPVRAPEGSRG